MNIQKTVQQLYSKRVFWYQLFISALGYTRGVRVYLKKNCTLTAGMKILDAGCGTGLITKSLHTIAHNQSLQNITFHAFDLTPSMLKPFLLWKEKQGAENIFIRQADILEPKTIPTGWQDYDLIIVSGMLEYLPKQRVTTSAKLLYNLLKPNGTFLIFLSKKNWLSHLVIERLWHADTYTKQEITTLLKQAGITNISFKSFSPLYTYLSTQMFIIEIKKSGNK